MGPMDFMTASLNIGLVITTLANALIKTYNNNKEIFTDPSTWHNNADKTPMGMVTKALGGVGTLIKDAALGIKEIVGMKLDSAILDELQGTKEKNYKDGKVGRIISILADSILQTYNSNPKIFKDDSFWHNDPEKTPFGMVMQCLLKVTPFVQEAIKNVNDISKIEGLTSAELSEKGELYKKIQGVVRASAHRAFSGQISLLCEGEDIWSWFPAAETTSQAAVPTEPEADAGGATATTLSSRAPRPLPVE